MNSIKTLKFIEYTQKNGYNTFIISGSSSTHLFKNTKDSLMGKIEEVSIFPMGFMEFLHFKAVSTQNNSLSEIVDYKRESNTNIDKIDELYSRIDVFLNRFFDLENEVTGLLKEYMTAGGYPEYFETKQSIIEWHGNLVDDIISKGLYRDIVSVYDIKNPMVLEKILFFIAV